MQAGQVFDPAAELDENFIDKEWIAMSTMPSSQPLRVHCPKLEAQRADGFVANSDATFSKKIFNISVAEAGVILEPDCIAYDM